MGDGENNLPPSMKRAAGRQLSRDNPGLDDDEESSEQVTGTFKRASDEVLASRRIVKIRRRQTSSAPSSNPFAGIRLVSHTDSTGTPAEVTTEAESGKTVSEEVEGKNNVNKETEKETDKNDKQPENKVNEVGAESTADERKTQSVNEATKPELAGEKEAEGNTAEKEAESNAEGKCTENEDKKENGKENAEKSAEAGSLNWFIPSSQEALTEFYGSGYFNSTFSFGSIPKDGSTFFGTPGASVANTSEGIGFPSMQEVPVETGEENEKAFFIADSVLFEFLDGGWKERGKGELKVNVPMSGTGKARLVMRARGHYSLILNASLYPDMKLTNMDKKGIAFACVNSAGESKDGLSTFALKFKDGSIVEEFRAAVMEHKVAHSFDFSSQPKEKLKLGCCCHTEYEEDVLIKEKKEDEADVVENRQTRESSDSEVEDVDVYHEMTYKEMRKYLRHFTKSEGFDVPAFPKVLNVSLIQPIPSSQLTYEGVYSTENSAIRAIREYNRRHNTNYLFVRVAKANAELTGVVTFYITFEAKDSADGPPRLFQAKVTSEIGEQEEVVELCRLAPSN